MGLHIYLQRWSMCWLQQDHLLLWLFLSAGNLWNHLCSISCSILDNQEEVSFVLLLVYVMICNLRKQQSEPVLSVLFDVKHSLGIKSLLWWVSLQPLTLLKDICHPLMWHYVKKLIFDICLQIGQSEETDLCFQLNIFLLEVPFWVLYLLVHAGIQ